LFFFFFFFFFGNGLCNPFPFFFYFYFSKTNCEIRLIFLIFYFFGNGLCNPFPFNGIVCNEAPLFPKVFDQKRWSQAEGRTRELLTHIQPNHTSEAHRNAVLSYLRSLIVNSVSLPCQVLSFLILSLNCHIFFLSYLFILCMCELYD